MCRILKKRLGWWWNLPAKGAVKWGGQAGVRGAAGGYTLLEAVAVMVITGIFSTWAIVSFAAVAGQGLETAAAVVVEDIRLTQQMNLNQDGVYTLIFDCARERYILAWGLGVSAYKTVTLPAGVDLSYTNFDRNRLGFDAGGKPRPRGGHLLLRTRRGRCLYVIVHTLTGRVRIDTKPP